MRHTSAPWASLGVSLRLWQGRVRLAVAFLCLLCGHFAVPATAALAPLAPATEMAARPFPLMVPLSYRWARGAAWLNALKGGCPGLDSGAHKGLAASGLDDVGGRLALCARLYSLEHRSPWDSPEPLVVVRLAPMPDAATALPRLMREADRLTVLRWLMADLEKTLLATQSRWPASLAQARKKAAELEAASLKLEGLWQALENVRATEGGWLCTPEIHAVLEQTVQAAPENAALWLLLAEARLQRGLAQAAVDATNEALRLMAATVGGGASAVQGRLAARARYVRGLGHWRLGQPALAETDLDASLDPPLAESAPQAEERAQRLRARGAVRLLRRNLEGMCEDFEAACALGDCEGLAVAREQGQCRPQPGARASASGAGRRP